MNLDLQDMTKRNGCFPGLEWWEHLYGDNGVDYQDVLNQLAKEDRVDWARWLMHEIGAPDKIYDVETHDINEVSLTMTPRQTRASGLPAGHMQHAFFAGNVGALDISISGTLLVAGRLQAHNVVAQAVIADGGIRAKRILVLENIICIGGLIMVNEMSAANIRAGACIIADTIRATGTVRAVTHVTCGDVQADSVVEYCTGLKPHKPRVGAAKTGHMGVARPAQKFTLDESR